MNSFFLVFTWSTRVELITKTVFLRRNQTANFEYQVIKTYRRGNRYEESQSDETILPSKNEERLQNE